MNEEDWFDRWVVPIFCITMALTVTGILPMVVFMLLRVI